MTAQEYLTELKRLLYPLSDDERKEAVAFYYESIADRIDEGLTEEEAIAKNSESCTTLILDTSQARSPYSL